MSIDRPLSLFEHPAVSRPVTEGAPLRRARSPTGDDKNQALLSSTSDLGTSLDTVAVGAYYTT